MKSPFPGMDPYLEFTWMWRDVHLSLIYALRTALAPQIAPRYYVALEELTYQTMDDPEFTIPDLVVVAEKPPRAAQESAALYETEAVQVELPASDALYEVKERYLEIRETATHEVITTIEILSPTNKRGEGRYLYEKKREAIFRSPVSLVEIDLLRGGRPLLSTKYSRSHYRILISRGWERPTAQLYLFNLDKLIPEIHIPLREHELEPTVKLNDIVHQVYETARYDLRIDYAKPPEPPLQGEWAEWARKIVESARQTT